MDTFTYLTTDELSDRIKYDARTIRNRLKDSVLLEGIQHGPLLQSPQFFLPFPLLPLTSSLLPFSPSSLSISNNRDG